MVARGNRTIRLKKKSKEQSSAAQRFAHLLVSRASVLSSSLFPFLSHRIKGVPAAARPLRARVRPFFL